MGGKCIDTLKPRRIPELDAIRGVAAMVVVLFHCWNAWPWPDVSVLGGLPSGETSGFQAQWWALLFKVTPLRFITAGAPCVGIFFLLSGLVLSLPMVAGRSEPYWVFLTKRFFRLYPPFAASILLAAVLCVAVDPHRISALSAWFNGSWDQPVSGQLLAGHLLMLGLDRDMHLNNVMWSLVHEVRISILFPLLVLATLGRPRLALAAAVATLCLVSSHPVFTWMSARLATGESLWPLATALDTARYLTYFVVGILLAWKLDPLVRTFAARRASTRVGLWTVAAALLLLHVGPFGDCAWVVGGALVILLSLSSSGAGRALRSRPLQWLGRVSYSLYLVHVPLLLLAMHAFYSARSAAFVLLAVPFASLIAAEAFYRCIENPSHRLGRRILPDSRRGDGSAGAAAAVRSASPLR